MKKLFLLFIVLFFSFSGFAQTYSIKCEGYYLSTPDQGIRNVNVTAMGTDGTVLGSCSTGSNTNCTITGDARMLTASYTFEHGYTKQKSLETNSYTVRAGFDESYVRESPTILKETDSGPSSSFPSGFKEMGDYVFYTAFTTDRGFQLWRYNIYTSAQLMISTPYPNIDELGDVRAFWIVGNKIFFASNGQIYRVDNPVNVLPTVSTVSYPPTLFYPSLKASVVVGQYFYFSSRKANNSGTALYRLDATTSVIVQININGTIGNATPSESYGYAPELVYEASANVVYFVGNDGAGSSLSNLQLWKLPVTSTTAAQVTTFASDNFPRYLTAWNDRLYFVATSGTYGTELYKTSTTGNSYSLEADINPGSGSSYPEFLTPAVSFDNGQNEMYFSTNQGIYRINTSSVFTRVLNANNEVISTSQPMVYNSATASLFLINFQLDDTDRLYWHGYNAASAQDLTFMFGLKPDKQNFEMAAFTGGIVFNETFTTGSRALSQIRFSTTTPYFPAYYVLHQTFSDNILPSLKGMPKLKNLTSLSSNYRVYFSAIGDGVRGFEPWFLDWSLGLLEMPEVNTKRLGLLNPNTIQTVKVSDYLVYNARYYLDANNSCSQELLKTKETQSSQSYIASPADRYSSIYGFENRLYVLQNFPNTTYITAYSNVSPVTIYAQTTTANVTSFNGPSGIEKTLYFTSTNGAAGTRGLWKTDGTTANTSLIDAESVLLFTKTCAWNNGVYYSKWSGGGGGAFYRYDHSTGVRSTIFSGGVNVTDFLEFNGYLFCRFSSGTGYGGIFRTDGTTRTYITLPTTSGGVTIPPAENVEAKIVGNRMVVAAKRGTNWFIYSSTDGVNFVEHFSQISNLKIIGGVGTKLLATTATSAPYALTIYDVSNNTSASAGLNFSSINYFPTIDNTVPSSQRIYFVGTPTGAPGNFLFRMDQTGLSFSLPVQLGTWVNVVDRPSPITLVGRSVYFVGTNAIGTDKYGTEMWVYNPERCPNGVLLASPTDNLIPPIGDTDFLSNATSQATSKIGYDYAPQNAGVLYSAANSITLLPGFEAKSGMNATSSGPKSVSFKAQIQGCSSVFPR